MESLDRLQCTIALDLYRTSNSIRNQRLPARRCRYDNSLMGGKRMVATQDEVTPKLLDVGRQAGGSSFRFTPPVRENVAA